MMKSPKIIVLSTLLALVATPALAQSGQNMQGGNMQGMNMGDMKDMMGMHTMPATVTALDTKTGIVDVNSDGMALKLHFPPASLADVKVGDKIAIHLGFTKEK
ncbi:MAG: hypothetical protein KGJ53_11370 [Alphaproteobacteria bacterium]|nr:hypothetical protein [Alphaproteobacteria bacterium]